MTKVFPEIILVGKPNVGKSTLFNTLIGRREAIVGEEHGLTRDFQEIKFSIDSKNFKLLDTAGIGLKKEKLNGISYKHTLEKIDAADLIFFLIDGSNEITIEDYNCANFLRKYKKKVVLIINKVELKESKNYKGMGYELGYGNPVSITAKSKSARLIAYNVIKSFLKPKIYNQNNLANKTKESEVDKITISISGKPNTGKSTLFNNIYGSKRVIVSPEAGTTRDSVKEEVNFKNYIFELIDTAGVKKKTKTIKSEVDRSSNYFSRKEIRYANVVIIVFDANLPFTNVELSLANYIINEGRAVLLVFNKWDLVKEKSKVKREILSKINSYFFDIKDVPSVFISAIKKNCKNIILDYVRLIYLKWKIKIKTSELNQWMHAEFLDPKPYQKSYISTKFRYISQTKTRPPTFSLYCNTKKKLNLSKIRSFKNRLRNKFGLEGIPIRINLKVSKNPYKKI